MGHQWIVPGIIVDGFLVGRRVHTGGMAVVWEVTRPDISFPILMKVPLLGEGTDPASIVGFEMEQMILRRLTGPHVPKFVAAGDFAVQPYLVLERIFGTPLLPYLENLPLPTAEVAAIGARVARALDDLHRQGVVHLDVKPSNIIIRPSGEAVLIDFGLSHHDALADLLAAQFVLPYGTAPYMAPEQVLGQRRDRRSDQFALGVLMYFFATGVRPFGNPQRLPGLKRRLWRDPQPPRKLRPDCPPWLQEIILRCLEVNPSQRYPTMEQLALELENFAQVVLTSRAERMHRDPLTMVLRRRFSEATTESVRSAAVAREDAPPVVVVALDLVEAAGPLADELRATVAHLLGNIPAARVAFLNVLIQGLITLDTTLDEQGQNKHLQRLVELRRWAAPLDLAESQATFHVLEEPLVASAILSFVRANHVDHIVMGARANSARRTLLGSVSGEVAAHAP